MVLRIFIVPSIPNFLLEAKGLIGKAKFHASGGSAFLQILDPKDKTIVSQVKAVLENAPDSVKKYFALVDQAKMTAIGADPHSPLALTGLNGTTFGAGTKELVETFKKVKGTHGYFPDHKQIQTGFVAYGPGLKKGVVVPVMNMTDVAPLVVKIAGLELPGMQGKLINEFLQ